jgi:flagellar biosynthetic protein FlhB
MEGKDGRTEQATAKRRDDERRKGNLPVSQEVLSVSALLTASVMLRFSFPGYITGARKMMTYSYLELSPGSHWSGEWVQSLALKGLQNVLFVMAPLLGALMLVGVVSSMGQTGPYFSWGAFKAGGLKALNPIKGVKRLFSLQSISKLFLTLLKIGLICSILWLVWSPHWNTIAQLMAFDLNSGLLWVGQHIFIMLISVCVFAILVAIIDTIITRRRHAKNMMMTKQEVKDERKQYEQKPEVKKAQSRKMRELLTNSLVAQMPKATVVITNPTRVAVAIQYDPSTMDAPKVIAKGMRLRAARIRELARTHGVPLVERPPLARSLYKSVSVGRSIPGELFEGVAEVLAYLHRLGHRLKGISDTHVAA